MRAQQLGLFLMPAFRKSKYVEMVLQLRFGAGAPRTRSVFGWRRWMSDGSDELKTPARRDEVRDALADLLHEGVLTESRDQRLCAVADRNDVSTEVAQTRSRLKRAFRAARIQVV